MTKQQKSAWPMVEDLCQETIKHLQREHSSGAPPLEVCLSNVARLTRFKEIGEPLSLLVKRAIGKVRMPNGPKGCSFNEKTAHVAEAATPSGMRNSAQRNLIEYFLQKLLEELRSV